MHPYKRPLSRKSGFSLVELTIVLLIIGVVAGSSLMVGRSMMEDAREAQTREKIRVIEDALMTYRKIYGRIPCPSDASLPPDHANYGVEAVNAPSCRSGGTPIANYASTPDRVVEGGIPIKTLQLPNEFMLDGWGNKFTYAMVRAYALSGFFAQMPPEDNCNAIRINDASGTARTTSAIYTIVSHGPNGHGAYTNTNNSVINAGSTNVDELQNCNCDSTGAATAYNITYVQKDITQNPASSTDSFDDIVIYKDRWQLEPVQKGVAGKIDTDDPNTPDAVFVNTTAGSTLVKTMKYGCSAFTATTLQPDFPDLGASATAGAVFDYSPDNQYFAVCRGTVFYIYKNDGTGTLNRVQNFNTAANCNGISFSPDASYMAVGRGPAGVGAAGNVIDIYTRTGDTFALTSTLTSALVSLRWPKFSDDGSYLYTIERTTVAPSNDQLKVFKHDGGGTYSFLQDYGPIANNTIASFCISNKHAAAYYSIAAPANALVLMHRSSGALEAMAGSPVKTNPFPAGFDGCAFSGDGNTLFLQTFAGHNPDMFIYKFDPSTDNFILKTSLEVNPSSGAFNTYIDVTKDGYFFSTAGGTFSLSVLWAYANGTYKNLISPTIFSEPCGGGARCYLAFKD